MLSGRPRRGRHSGGSRPCLVLAFLGNVVIIGHDDAVGWPRGQRGLRHSNFYRRAWMPAIKAAGLEGVHLHDLRHTGSALAGEEGANLREMMERMGHDSMRAVLIHLHASAERQRVIADRMSRNAKTSLGKPQRSGM